MEHSLLRWHELGAVLKVAGWPRGGEQGGLAHTSTLIFSSICGPIHSTKGFLESLQHPVSICTTCIAIEWVHVQRPFQIAPLRWVWVGFQPKCFTSYPIGMGPVELHPVPTPPCGAA
jgi:hypothetical protein